MADKKMYILIMTLLLILAISITGCGLFDSANTYDNNAAKTDTGVKTVTLAEGGTYTGEVKDGKPHGKGEASYDDGSKYSGEFRSGEKYGEGQMVYADGSSYTGTFRADRMQGEGVFIYADGRRYEGGFKNDLFDGRGVLIWSEEIRYVGQWKEGHIFGGNTYNWPVKNRSLNDSALKDTDEESGFIIEGEAHTPYY